MPARGFASAPPAPGYETRIRNFIDSLRAVDTHEHLFEPENLLKTYFLDFTLLLQQNSWDDLVSAGMPDTLHNYLFNTPLSVQQKWKAVEPYWKKCFNTTSNRVLMRAVKDIYGFTELNDSTVSLLSHKMKEVYGKEWLKFMVKDVCRFDYVLQESDFIGDSCSFVRYTNKFSEWLTIRSKYTLDSLAATQVDPIYTLDDFVRSQKNAFENALESGMVAVKINIAYERTLSIDDVSYEAARKVFRTLVNGDESYRMSWNEAKPLQDFMVHQLLMLARRYNLPVAFHTGMQAGAGNNIDNSDPSLLTGIFMKYPDIRFVLYHGSYPYGGKLSVLAKTFRNVWVDMNWTWSISPSYAAAYLKEFLETVPVSKIMAFGGDQRCIENTYGELRIAKKIISDVLIESVTDGSLTEAEALTVAKMILRDNAVGFYNLVA